MMRSELLYKAIITQSKLQRHQWTILWVLRKVKFEGKRHCSVIKLIISSLEFEQLDATKYKKLEKTTGSQRTVLRYIMWRLTYKHKLANRFQKELWYNFVILLLQKTQYIIGYILCKVILHETVFQETGYNWQYHQTQQ